MFIRISIHFGELSEQHPEIQEKIPANFAGKTSIVTSTSQGQKFQKFEEYPKSVRIKMADLAGR